MSATETEINYNVTDLYKVDPLYMKSCVSRHSSSTDTWAKGMEGAEPHLPAHVCGTCRRGISAPVAAGSGAASLCYCAAHLSS